ncbi:MAG: hypothetical protein Q8K86_05870 [Candidatus Nanopelagicaceae bacterium]|nr:hypothetical protein [Candidatus Nanopelagicaceae bacterium]
MKKILCLITVVALTTLVGCNQPKTDEKKEVVPLVEPKVEAPKEAPKVEEPKKLEVPPTAAPKVEAEG